MADLQKDVGMFSIRTAKGELDRPYYLQYFELASCALILSSFSNLLTKENAGTLECHEKEG